MTARKTLGDIIEIAHQAESLSVFRTAVLCLLHELIDFDSGIFFTTGDRADAGPPSNFNKPPEAPALFQHYRANLSRFRSDIDKAHQASRREGAIIDSVVYSLHERLNMPFFAEVLKPQHITTRLMAHLSFRGGKRSVVQLCRHDTGHGFQARDVRDLNEIVPALALADFSVQQAAAVTGVRPPAGERFFDLSEREREVVAHVRYGYTNKEIGVLLGISGNTVRNHLAAIFDKLGVATRAELAAWVAHAEHDRDGR